jgi:D-alanine-D-alanine ligase
MANARVAVPTPQHWTDTVYRTNALLLYDVEAALFQNVELTREEIHMLNRIAEALAGKIDSPILDLACGPGRHSIQLAREGYGVTGLDFSEEFLKIADARAKRERTTPAPHFACGDMRNLEFPDGSFRTAVIFGNSFGYFSDEENIGTLREVHRVLGDGGLFCVEITNKERYLETLEPVEQELIESERFGRLKSEWRKTWDGARSRVKTWEKHSSAISGKILYEGPYEVRLYDKVEMEELLRGIGFRSVVSLAFSPARDSLANGLGETFGAMGEVLFAGAMK